MFLLCRWGNWGWDQFNNVARFTEPERTAKAGIKTLLYPIPKTLLFAQDHLYLASIFSSTGCKKVYRIIVRVSPHLRIPVCLWVWLITYPQELLSLPFHIPALRAHLLLPTGSLLGTHSQGLVLLGDGGVFRETPTWSKDLLFVSLLSLSSFVRNTIDHDDSHWWI